MGRGGGGGRKRERKNENYSLKMDILGSAGSRNRFCRLTFFQFQFSAN